MVSRKAIPIKYPTAFARGVKIETAEHHLPRKITVKLVTDHMVKNPHEYDIRKRRH